MGLTVKHLPIDRPPNPGDQSKNARDIVAEGVRRKASADTIAGAVATCIQESDLHNNLVQDVYGSAGLFGQRAIYYGGYANTINTTLAIKKFYDSYLSYIAKGKTWYDASDSAQEIGRAHV